MSALLPALALLAWRSPERKRALASLLAAPLFFSLYPAWLDWKTGDAFAFVHSERIWHRSLSAAGPLGGLWLGVQSAWAGLEQLVTGNRTHVYWKGGIGSDAFHGAVLNLEDFAFVAVFLVLAVIAWRRVGARLRAVRARQPRSPAQHAERPLAPRVDAALLPDGVPRVPCARARRRHPAPPESRRLGERRPPRCRDRPVDARAVGLLTDAGSPARFGSGPRESRWMPVRPRSALITIIVAAALGGLWSAGPAAARTVPGSPPFRVLIMNHLSGSQLRRMAQHGAVGLLVPGAGPTTNRRRALAQLVRGEPMNANLGGVPSGPPVIEPRLATGTPNGSRLIVVVMPPKGPPVANDIRYPVVVLGGGFHGLLDSQTTRIPGLVSIVDIAPTALGRERGSLSSVASPTPSRASPASTARSTRTTG